MVVFRELVLCNYMEITEKIFQRLWLSELRCTLGLEPALRFEMLAQT